MPVHICESHISPAEAECALGVLDTEQVEHGCVQVMDVPLVFDRFVSKVIGFSNTCSAFDPASSHPDGEAEWIMVPSVGSLSKRGTAKFSGPYNKGFIEHAPGFKILNQPGDRLVDGHAVFIVPIHQILVLVPAVSVASGAGQFDEAHAPLDQTASDEALFAKGLVFLKVESNP